MSTAPDDNDKTTIFQITRTKLLYQLKIMSI